MISEEQPASDQFTAERKRTVYEEINWEWIEHVRGLSVPEKNRIAFAMADFALTQKRLILAEKNPDWSAEEVDYEAKRLVFGVSREDFR